MTTLTVTTTITTNYWVATYLDYGNDMGTYIPTAQLSYSKAITYVKAGGNVFADSRKNAYRLTSAVGNGRESTRKEILIIGKQGHR